MKKGIISVCIASLLFGGCKYVMKEDIMAKPKVEIINEKIQDQLERNIPKGFTMLDDTNSITLTDIDLDGEDEIITIYKNDEISEQTVLRIAIYHMYDDKLELVDTMDMNGREIRELLLEDIDNDGNLEIIAHIRTNDIGDANQYCLQIYKYKKQLTKTASILTDKYKLVDINNNGKKELITAYKEDIIFSSIRLYEYKDETYICVNEEQLGDSTVKEITTGYVTDDLKGIYVYSTQGANASINHLFYYEDEKLINPFNEEDNMYSLEYITRTGRVLDINHDGILEVPIYNNLDTNEENNQMEVKWYKWSKPKKQLEQVAVGIGNHYHDYQILLSTKLQGKVRYGEKQEDELYIDRYNIELEDKQQPLFEIITVYNRKKASQLDEEYRYIKNYQDKIYFYRSIDEQLCKYYEISKKIKDNFVVGWRE